MRASMIAAAAGLLVMSVTAASAQGPGSFAERRLFSPGIQVDAAMVASDGCQTILAVGGGSPVPLPPSAFVRPVTVVVGPDPAGCSGNRVVRRVFSVGGTTFHDLVEIFFVSPDGRILKTEKVAIANG